MFSKALKIVDLIVSLALLPILLLVSLILILVGKQKRRRESNKSLLVLQAFHSYDSIAKSGHEELITQTDLDGFFDKVYTVYPILGANPFDSLDSYPGFRRIIEINNTHTFYEYKMSIFKPARFQVLGFLVSQFLMLLQLRKLVKRENIAVIRGNCPFLTGLYALVVSKWCDRPFSLRIGGNFDLMYKNGLMSYQRIFKRYWVQKIIGKFVFKRADNICAVNDNNLQYCVDNGANPDKCQVIRYGNVVDPIHFVDPKERNKGLVDYDFSGRRVVLCVGRMTSVKHPEDVLEVTKIASRSIPDLLTVFVGEGEMRAELERRAFSEGVGKNVLFLGNKKQDYLAELYSLSDAYLSPLTGRSMVEAALAGLPLIAYDYEWHSEIVIPGKTGELVSYRSVGQMAQKLVDLLGDQDYLDQLGVGARSFTLDLMDKEKIRRQELGVFTSLMTA